MSGSPSPSGMKASWRRRLTVPQFILLLVATTVLLGLCTLGLYIWQDRKDSLAEHGRNLAALAVLMEEQARSAIETQTLVLDKVEQSIWEAGGVRAFAGDPEAGAKFRQVLDAAPVIHSLWLVDERGFVVASTMELPPTDTGDRSDREFFKALSQDRKARDFIGPLTRGRVSGFRIFTVNRRLNDAKGDFAGVLQITMRAERFSNFYQRLSDDPSAIFGIYKSGGDTVVGYPVDTHDGASAQHLSALFREILKEGEEGVHLLPQFPGTPRMIAFHTIPEYDLVLMAGLSHDSVMSAWRERAGANLLAAGVGIAVFAILAYFAFQAARRSEAARLAAAQAHQAKVTFFASASHDLRQPYQAMRLFFSVAEGRAGQSGDATLIQAVSRLGKAMDAGEELLNALLDVATLEAGSVVPRISVFALEEVLFAERDSFSQLAETRGLRLSVLPTGAVVRSDPVLLRRIVRNLLVNAIKYTDRGGALIGCRRRGDKVHLQVWDTGRGIPEDKQQAIFEDFFQLDNPARSHDGGLGLGLSVVARTSRLLGHRVMVQSRPGRGSVFTVILPAAALPLVQNPHPIPNA